MTEKTIVERAVNLASLLDYQQGSVVSRTIIDRTTGTVTLFAFDAGEGLSEHTAPFDALVYLLDGEMQVVISDKAHAVTKGDMLIMPANKPHALKAVVESKMILIMLRL